jgi:hypothetical protein
MALHVSPVCYRELKIVGPNPAALTSGTSEELAHELSIAFGIDEVRLYEVIARHRYILTFDVRASGVPVVHCPYSGFISSRVSCLGCCSSC